MHIQDSLSLLVCHCSFSQKLARPTRNLLQGVLDNENLVVRVICPSEHKKHISEKDRDSRLIWPREKIRELLIRRLPKTNILLASNPVLDAIPNFSNLEVGYLGNDAFEQLDLIPAQLKRIFEKLKISFSNDKFWKNTHFLILNLAQNMKSKIEMSTHPNKNHLEFLRKKIQKLESCHLSSQPDIEKIPNGINLAIRSRHDDGAVSWQEGGELKTGTWR